VLAVLDGIRSEGTEAEMGADELRSRLTAVEGEVLLLQREIDSIRLALRSQAAPTSRSASPDVGEPMHPRQPFPPRPASSVVHQASARKSPAVSAPTPRVPKAPRLEIDFAELFGAQAFAWAGGVVTLLGVLFFFALAVNHGWIGPTARVALGGGASVGVVLAALWLRRRFGETYASLAGAGAGIAGGYGTLAAATALYDLVSKPVALAAGAAIAAVAVAIALAWRAELVAALGVVGAIGAPALLAVQGGLTVAGTGFAAVMAVAAGVLGVRIRWTWVLVAAAVAGVPQIAVLVIEAHRSDFGTVAVACVFALLYLATGVAEQLARKDDTLAPLPVAFVVGSIGVCWLTADQLFGPVQALRAGTALLVAAGVFFVVTVTVWRRGQRELGTLLGAIALAAAAVGVADALSGATIAYTFAAEAVVLGVAAQRLREPRVLLGALAYIVLAGAHALAFDAPPKALFEAARHPASGAGALASVAAAAFAVGYLSRTPWRASAERGVLRFVGVIVAALRAHIEELRVAAVATGCLFAANALSLLVLECCERVWPSGGVVASFHRGHVVLTALWSLVGLVAVVVASRRGAATARLLAYGWLAVTAVKVAAYDWSRLVGPGFLLAFVTLAGALLLAAFFDELLARRARLAEETLAVVLAAVGFGVASTYHLDGGNNRGYAFLAMAGVVGGLAASIFRRASFRDLATLLWVPALALAAAAYGLLLDGSWLTLAWSAGAAVLASLAVATSERRLELASFGYLALAAGGAFVEAPPWHLVVARTHPAHGIAGLLLLVCALLACAWPLRAREGWARWWWSSLWAAGAVALYAASLVILELSVRISTASLHTDFQRGHSAVSAVWGLLGLVLLYLGLRRSRRALRLAGFVLFAVSLGKLFVYDLSQLSSITRALSVLAVGAVLLLAGFFTQRLTRQLGGGDGDELHQPVV
jgi:uncharacterized membrane protein